MNSNETPGNPKSDTTNTVVVETSLKQMEAVHHGSQSGEEVDIKTGTAKECEEVEEVAVEQVELGLSTCWRREGSPDTAALARQFYFQSQAASPIIPPT